MKYSIAAGKNKVVRLSLPAQALRGVRPHHSVKLVVVYGSAAKKISVRR